MLGVRKGKDCWVNRLSFHFYIWVCKPFNKAACTEQPMIRGKEWVKVKVKLLSHVRLCDPMECSRSGSSVHGIFQARVLAWVPFSFSRGSSQPRDRTLVSCTVSRRFTVWATREAPWHKRTFLQNRNRDIEKRVGVPRGGGLGSLGLADANYHIQDGWTTRTYCIAQATISNILG